MRQKKKFTKIIQKSKTKKNNINTNYSVFIGNSGSIIEALENGKKVIQITEDNVFDFYNQKIWKNIISKKFLKIFLFIN